MIPRKYASLNSPIMAINVITSCLSTLPSDCSSILSVIDNNWKVKGEIITETEISQLSTISEKECFNKENELEYQDCSDDPSILFGGNSMKSNIFALVDAKKIKPALALYLLYAYPVKRARIYKSFPKILDHEVRYAKEQALWSPPNNHIIHSVILMISDIVGIEQKNFHPPIIEKLDSVVNIGYSGEKYQVIIKEDLINSETLENDIDFFINKENDKNETIKFNEKSKKFRKYVKESKIRNEESINDKNKSFIEEKYTSQNFKGTMNINDRIMASENSDVSEYFNKLTKKRCNIEPHPLNVYFSKDNIQFKEYVNYYELPERLQIKPLVNLKTTIPAGIKDYKISTKSSTIVDTINEDEALEEGDINYSMIETEISDVESSIDCNTSFWKVNCEKLTQQINDVYIENQYTNDSSKLISLPNTFSFLSENCTTSCEIQTSRRTRKSF